MREGGEKRQLQRKMEEIARCGDKNFVRPPSPHFSLLVNLFPLVRLQRPSAKRWAIGCVKLAPRGQREPGGKNTQPS